MQTVDDVPAVDDSRGRGGPWDLADLGLHGCACALARACGHAPAADGNGLGVHAAQAGEHADGAGNYGAFPPDRAERSGAV